MVVTLLVYISAEQMNQLNTPGEDKRISSRFQLELEGILTCVKENGRGPENTVYTRDLSPSGVYLLAENPLEVDDKIELHLSLPSLEGYEPDNPVVILGTVVRVDGFPGREYGLAIKFDTWLSDTVLHPPR